MESHLRGVLGDAAELGFVGPFSDETEDARTGITNPPNWTTVLRDLASEPFRSAFRDTDYMIVQIDSDVCEEAFFGVGVRDQGVLVGVDEIVVRFRQDLITRINFGEAGFYERHQSQIIFAIAVDSIECWLLPLYRTGDRRSRTFNCLEQLNDALRPKGMGINKDSKQHRMYQDLSRDFGKTKRLKGVYPHNASLKIFVDELFVRFPPETAEAGSVP